MVSPTQYDWEVWLIVQMSKHDFAMYLLLFVLFWERNWFVRMDIQAGDIRTKTLQDVGFIVLFYVSCRLN